MKNAILSLLLLLVGTSGFTQATNYNVSFEAGTTLGAWNYFENGSNTAGVKLVANPFSGGVNTSATVAKFTASRGGGEWSGCESLYGTLGKWKFNPTSPTKVTVDVYKKTLAPVYIKFTSTNNAGQGTVFLGSAIPSAVNQWVTLTYTVDFATLGGADNADNNAGTNQIVFHLDGVTNRTADQDVYFDNIKFTAAKLADPIAPPATVAVPTVHAPTPPNRNATDVVTIYSGKYAQLTGTRIGKNWGEATIASDITVDGDLTKQLLQFNYQGIELGTPINVVGFQKLHIDFFKTNQAQIKLSIIHQGGGDITKLLSIANAGWNSFDIPLSDFAGLNLATIHQLKLEGAPTQGITTVFFDNLYFYKGTPTSLQTFDERSISLYPNPVKNTLRIDAPDAITNIAIFNMLGQEVLSLKPNSASISLQTTTLAKGTYIIKANLNGKQATSTFVKE
jgi:Secretion system C-terminal sorting domain